MSTNLSTFLGLKNPVVSFLNLLSSWKLLSYESYSYKKNLYSHFSSCNFTFPYILIGSHVFWIQRLDHFNFSYFSHLEKSYTRSQFPQKYHTNLNSYLIVDSSIFCMQNIIWRVVYVISILIPFLRIACSKKS